EATTKVGGAMPADSAAPARIVPSVHITPRSRCTKSLSTSARPITSTPLWAINPKPTGTRHGPLGMHFVPALPISQLAAGMQARKAIGSAYLISAAPIQKPNPKATAVLLRGLPDVDLEAKDTDAVGEPGSGSGPAVLVPIQIDQ